MNTLAGELPRQMARIRDEVIPAYVAIGPAGAFALTAMRQDLDRAARAMAEGDVIAMLSSYRALAGYKL